MRIDTKDARIIINALKNGGIPKKYIDEVMIGRDDEVKEFKRNLEQLKIGSGTLKFILGSYGTGKSFLVHELKEIALEDDFVVAMMQIDRVFRMNKLDDLYYYVMHHLYVKNTKGLATFDDIFEIWIDNLKNAPDKVQSTQEINQVIKEIQKYNDTFARALLNYIRSKIKNDEKLTRAISSWLSGEQNIPYEVKKKFNVIGSVDKSNMFDFFKAFSKLTELLGYNGLIITIDEIDLITNERSDIRTNAYENMKHLIDLTVSGDLIKTMFLFTGAESIVADEEKGILSNEALSQRLGISRNTYDDGFKNIRESVIYLDSISPDHYLELTHRILKLYKKAYGSHWDVDSESIKNWVLYTYHKEEKDIYTLKTREFIIRLIKILETIDQNFPNHIYLTGLNLKYSNKQPIFKNVLKGGERT